jgi:hypothetical protein
MIKDIFSSFKENLKQKTTNPFFGTLIIVWIIHNWEFIFTFFNFEENSTLENKTTFLGKHLSSIPFLKNLFICILITFSVLILTYIFLNLSRLIINVFEKKITPWVYKVTDKSSIVLKSDYQILELERNHLINKVEEERKAKLESQNEVTNLEERLKELMTPKDVKIEDIKIEDIVNSNVDSLNDNSKIVSSILNDENKSKIFGKLIDSNNNDDYFELTKENLKDLNYFLRAEIIHLADKSSNNYDFRKYGFTDYGNKIKREYINKTLHNTV